MRQEGDEMAQPCGSSRAERRVTYLKARAYALVRMGPIRMAKRIIELEERLGDVEGVDEATTHPQEGFEGILLPQESPDGGVIPPPVHFNWEALDAWLARHPIHQYHSSADEVLVHVNSALLRQERP